MLIERKHGRSFLQMSLALFYFLANNRSEVIENAQILFTVQHRYVNFSPPEEVALLPRLCLPVEAGTNGS